MLWLRRIIWQMALLIIKRPDEGMAAKPIGRNDRTEFALALAIYPAGSAGYSPLLPADWSTSNHTTEKGFVNQVNTLEGEEKRLASFEKKLRVLRWIVSNRVCDHRSAGF